MNAMGSMAHGASSLPSEIRSVCELAILIAVLLTLGLAIFAAAIAPDKPPPHFTSDYAGRTLLLFPLAALLIAPLQLLSTVAAMAGTGMTQGFTFVPQVLQETNFGRAWLASFSLLLVLTAAARWLTAKRRRLALLAALALTLLAIHALVSHAIDFGKLAVISYVVHETAAGLWSGALLGLVLAARHNTKDLPVARLIVVRTSRLAGWSVALLVTTGIYLAYCALGLNLDHLLYSAYGRTLIAKVSVFGVLLLMGGYNRYWLVPRFSVPSARSELMQSVRVELLMILGVFALAVLLANTPPSH